MMLTGVVAMNSLIDRRFPRFALCVVLALLLILATVTAAQTNDNPQPSKSVLGQISGRVYRSDTGEPVPKAQVSLYPADPDTAKAGGPERIVRSAVDGTFVFPDLPAGTYGVSVRRNGFSEYSQQEEDDFHPQSVTLKPGEKLDSLSLRLHPTGVIAGQVSDEDGDGVQGLEVFALRISFQPGGEKQVSTSGRTVTDDLGNFRLPNLAPGSYLVSAGGLIEYPKGAEGLKQSPTGGVQYRNTFYGGTSSLDGAQVLRVGPQLTTNDIRLTAPTEGTYAITGKVLSGAGRSPLKNAQVSCERTDAAGYTFSEAIGPTVVMESDHSFKCSPVSPGDYTLKLKTVDTGVEKELGFASVRVVDSNVCANIEAGRAAEVRGSVVGPQGLSLAGKLITLETFGPGFYLLHESPGVDPAGRFAITNIPPGEFFFSVSDTHGEESAYVKKAICNGRDYASREFALAVGTTLDCDVTLAGDTSAIHGEVADGDHPARGLEVVLVPDSRELRRIPRYTRTAKTDVGGQYKMAGVIPGDYLLFAIPPSTDHEYFALDFPERHTDIAERVTVDPGTTQAVNLKAPEVEAEPRR
jgi:hypothetical protein